MEAWHDFYISLTTNPYHHYLQSSNLHCTMCNSWWQTKMRPCLTPAQDSQSIDHCSVGVCSHQAIRVEIAIMVKHHSGQVLQVYLVNNPWTRRNDAHVPEGFRAPLGRTGNIFKGYYNVIESCCIYLHTSDQSEELTLSFFRLHTFKNWNLSLLRSNSKFWFFWRLSDLKEK